MGWVGGKAGVQEGEALTVAGVCPPHPGSTSPLIGGVPSWLQALAGSKPGSSAQRGEGGVSPLSCGKHRALARLCGCPSHRRCCPPHRVGQQPAL